MIEGAVLAGRNWSSQQHGSIHDDATAQRLGFRGGTVAGSIHLNQFVPVCLEAFGQEWFERGGLSLYFVEATLDGEPIQVTAEAPESQHQVRTWMKRADTGALVAEGTISLGDHSSSELQTRDLRADDPTNLRMLSGFEPGQRLGRTDTKPPAEQQAATIAAGDLTTPLAWYTDDSPWGGPIAAPSFAVHLLWATNLGPITKATAPSVGLFGAIEVAHLDGPLLLDRLYEVESRVVAVGQSPKTEYVWFDSVAFDGERAVASMRMLLRFMKASSPLYAS